MKPTIGTVLYFDGKPLGTVIKPLEEVADQDSIVSFSDANGVKSCVIWLHTDGSLNPRLDWAKYD